jgi:uncharacterized protein (TIGR00369 family)
MKRIRNPFSEMGKDTYQCFGCSPYNENGLKLEFSQDENGVVAEWVTGPGFEGWHGIIHGGIQATLMDETASWCILTRCGTAGVTTEMRIKYLRPLSSAAGKVFIKACLGARTAKIATVACTISDADGNEYATGEVNYFLFPENVARDKYNYPGVDAFSEE